MKAIRQDLTLQNIKDEFAAEVYESHARLALENRDYSNYKQCQASLQGLYAGVSVQRGARPAATHALYFPQGASGNTSEFTAYSILYSVCTNRCPAALRPLAAALADGAHRSQTEIKKLLRELDPVVAKGDANIQHALRVRTAMADSNYCLFFKLYREVPALGKFLMDYCVEQLRQAALNIMTKVRPRSRAALPSLHAPSRAPRAPQSFRPVVPPSAVRTQLGFSDIDECEQWMAKRRTESKK